MAIRFHCVNCRKMIEVDDEYAGQAAQCPYCATVVDVPRQSEPPAAPVARPADDRPAPPGGAAWDAPVHTPSGAGPVQGPWERGPAAAPPPLVDRSARRWAWISLVLGALGAATFVLAVGAATIFLARAMSESPDAWAAPPPPEEIERLEQEFMESTAGQIASIGALLGALGAAVGLPFGIASLRRSPRGNPVAWVGTVLCGACVLCICTGMLTSRGGLPGG